MEILVNLEIQIPSDFHIFPRGGGNIWAYSLKKTEYLLHIISIFWIYYRDSDVFLADSVDLADISDFFPEYVDFCHDGW